MPAPTMLRRIAEDVDRTRSTFRQLAKEAVASRATHASFYSEIAATLDGAHHLVVRAADIHEEMEQET